MILKTIAGQELLPAVKAAEDAWTRLWGMIPVDPAKGPQAMWFPRCNAIHMFFMRFPLDLVFLDRDGYVVKILARVRPWTPWAACLRADSVLEVISGTWDVSLVKPGDRLILEPSSSRAEPSAG